MSKYIVIKEVNNVYDCLLKDEDLYNIYNKRAEQAIAKMRQEVGFSNDKIKKFSLTALNKKQKRESPLLLLNRL